MGRSPCCDENGLKKGPWTPEEDQKLVDYIEKHGHGSWRALPKLSGLNRCGKSCRLRWTNYLRPDIKRGKFSPEEEQTILNLHSILGNKWSAIATHLPGRTDNEIKNFWNTHLKKKLIQMGFDPMTHRPRTDFFSTLPHLLALANLKQFVDRQPWDDHAVRLQAEAVQAAKMQYLEYLIQTAGAMASNTDISSMSSTMGATDMDSLNLLSSQMSSSVPRAVVGAVQGQFGHLEELQMPPWPEKQYSNETNHDSTFVGFSQGENNSNTPRTPLASASSSLPPLTDYSAGNPEDACSSSRCGGIGCGDGGGSVPFWPELLLDDPFILEFA